MSGDAKDLRVGGLELIAQGITLTLDELKELGMTGRAGAGRGFEELALGDLELGHGELVAGLKSFCERWEWGVRSLVNEGNAFAQGVGLSAGTFHETDQYVGNSLKIAVNSLNGNPYATEEEVTQKSWGDLVKQHPLADPDYSADSFEKATDNVGQAYKDAARDAATSPLAGPLSPQNLTGQSDEEYEAMLDDRFGPSAEERAETSRQFLPQQPEGGADGPQQGGDRAPQGGHRAPRGGDTG